VEKSGYASEDSKTRRVLRLTRSAAAGPGGRTDQPLGAEFFGYLRFQPGYGAKRLHSDAHKEQREYGVNRKIPKRDGKGKRMVNLRQSELEA
jgi:hypothetical protein